MQFNLEKGTVLANKYVIGSKLGSGYEGEVYRIVEQMSGIEFAAKLYYKSKPTGRNANKAYAKKLYTLQDNPIIAKYHTHEQLSLNGKQVSMHVIEYVNGILLSDYIRKLPGMRLRYYEAIHLFHSILKGLEAIHEEGHYHGDLHTENIIVKKLGLHYQLKFLDFYEQINLTKKEKQLYDLVDAVVIFYQLIGGQKWYSKHPKEIKNICCGLKKYLIKRKFKNVNYMLNFIESTDWLSLTLKHKKK